MNMCSKCCSTRLDTAGNCMDCGKTPDSSSDVVRRRKLPPRMPYEQWRALRPEKAAEYLARRLGYSAKSQGKLWAILESVWKDPPNAGVSEPPRG